MTAEEAAQAIRDGRTVKMTVGESDEDPVLLLTLERGCVMANAIAGWSAGVVEPVCSIESDFLTREYLQNRHALEVVEGP